MITKFNTATVAPGATSKGGNGLLWFLGLAAVAWAGYEFWWKPKQEKEKANASNNKQ